jgi:hypothetical protein
MSAYHQITDMARPSITGAMCQKLTLQTDNLHD